jgi:DsbC/DsbD-like thiol-disulfide interchange protein
MPLVFVLCSLLLAAVQRPADVVRWTAAAPAASAAPGTTVKITVAAKVQSGWKLYAIDQPADGPEPLTFGVARDSGFSVTAKQITAPRAKVQNDENFGLQTRYYENDVSFTVPVGVPRSAHGVSHVPLEITFQACGQNICLRPYTEKLQVPITISR